MAVDATSSVVRPTVAANTTASTPHSYSVPARAHVRCRTIFHGHAAATRPWLRMPEPVVASRDMSWMDAAAFGQRQRLHSRAQRHPALQHFSCLPVVGRLKGRDPSCHTPSRMLLSASKIRAECGSAMVASNAKHASPPPPDFRSAGPPRGSRYGPTRPLGRPLGPPCPVGAAHRREPHPFRRPPGPLRRGLLQRAQRRPARLRDAGIVTAQPSHGYSLTPEGLRLIDDLAPSTARPSDRRAHRPRQATSRPRR